MSRTLALPLALVALLAALGPPGLQAHEEPRVRIAQVSARLDADPAAPAELYLERADLYRQAQAWEAALADLASAERREPGGSRVGSEVERLRALTLYDAGRPAEALVAIDRCLARQGGQAEPARAAEAYVLRARIETKLGRPLAAACDYTRGLAAFDSREARDEGVAPSPDLYLERARALAADPARLAEAVGGLDEGLERLGPVPALSELRSALAVRLGRGARAVAPRAQDETIGGDGRLRIGAAPPIAPAASSAAPGVPSGAKELQVVTRGPYLQSASPTGLVVRWRTSAGSDSRVRFGTSFPGLDRVADASAGVIDHAVTLSGLTPSTRYFYTVGSTTEVLAGHDGSFSFVTPPPVGAAQATRIWVLGDSGTANASAAAVREAYRAFTGARPTDLWLMLGDNAYETGSDAEYQAAVFDLYPDFLRTVALWPTLGNHDAFNPNVYFQIFSLPTLGEAGGVPSGTESYYSFDYANLHLVCLDSQISDRSPQGAMLTWLRADLARNRQPWVIAFWHHPPYSKGSHDSDSEINLVEMRQNALPILEAAGVDLVLAGHSHSYERSFLLDRHYGLSGSLVPGMILDGGDGNPAGGGAYEKGTGPHEGAVYAVAGSSGQVATLGHHPAMVVGLAVLGSLVLDVHGDRLDATFLEADGRQGDAFTLHKALAPPPPPPPPPTTTATFLSVPAQDGFLTESRAGSGVGGAASPALSAGAALRLGDLAGDRQLRAIVSFDTSALPDGATIVEARLRLTRGARAGTDPFTTHGRCRVEIRRGVFGGSRALAASDFSASPTETEAGTLSAPGADGVAEATLSAAALTAIHKGGTTQLRLSFERAADGDGRADYVGFFAGESPLPAQRPQLVVTYR